MGLEGIGAALIIYYLVLLIAGAAAMAMVAGIICLAFQQKKLGIFLIAPSTIILSIVFSLWFNSLPKKHTVFLDLTKPLEKHGIPRDAHWLKQHDYFLGDYSICEVNGKVSLTVILPDGKKIEEKINSIIANYGTNGFYGIQIDNYQKMNSDQAIAQIHAEAQKWSVGAKNKDKIFHEEQDVKDWVMGNPRNGQSYYAGIYCEEDKYVMFSQAMHSVADQNQFVWRYAITMGWEFDARAKQFHK